MKKLIGILYLITATACLCTEENDWQQRKMKVHRLVREELQKATSTEDIAIKIQRLNRKTPEFKKMIVPFADLYHAEQQLLKNDCPFLIATINEASCCPALRTQRFEAQKLIDSNIKLLSETPEKTAYNKLIEFSSNNALLTEISNQILESQKIYAQYQFPESPAEEHFTDYLALQQTIINLQEFQQMLEKKNQEISDFFK